MRKWFIKGLAAVVIVAPFFLFPLELALWIDGVLLLASAAIGDVLSQR